MLGASTSATGGDCGSQEASTLDEGQLVGLAKNNAKYFGVLYDRHYGRILNYIYRRTFDLPTAEELTSNTFLRAIVALPQYEHRSKFSAWLYRIACNEIRLHWRTTRRRRDGAASWREDYARVRYAANQHSAPEQVEEQAQQFALLHDAIRRLPEQYQTVLALRYFEGMSYDEVAEVLDDKLGTVKSLIHRGLKRLRRQLELTGANPFLGAAISLHEERTR
jgi:RNA polymerase sigma-70 factor (ECF subfamily)